MEMEKPLWRPLTGEVYMCEDYTDSSNVTHYCIGNARFKSCGTTSLEETSCAALDDRSGIYHVLLVIDRYRLLALSSVRATRGTNAHIINIIYAGPASAFHCVPAT